MQHSIDELRTLARRYLEETGVRAHALSRRILGDQSEKIISRLLEGHSCWIDKGELVSVWFLENWPLHAPWPEGVPKWSPKLYPRKRVKRPVPAPEKPQRSIGA